MQDLHPAWILCKKLDQAEEIEQFEHLVSKSWDGSLEIVQLKNCDSDINTYSYIVLKLKIVRKQTILKVLFKLKTLIT